MNIWENHWLICDQHSPSEMCPQDHPWFCNPSGVFNCMFADSVAYRKHQATSSHNIDYEKYMSSCLPWKFKIPVTILYQKIIVNANMNCQFPQKHSACNGLSLSSTLDKYSCQTKCACKTYRDMYIGCQWLLNQTHISGTWPSLAYRWATFQNVPQVLK